MPPPSPKMPPPVTAQQLPSPVGRPPAKRARPLGAAGAPRAGDLRAALPQILAAIPQEWRGTTFNNSALLGREGFAASLTSLVARKAAAGEHVTEEDLVKVGNAEDYLRVATNIATTLELALADEKGYSVSQVFTFASTAMPIVAVVLTARTTVHLYTGHADVPFSQKQQDMLALLGGKLVCHDGSPVPHPQELVLALHTASSDIPSGVDGCVTPNVLYIVDPKKIVPADILVMRKRMATPATTPMAEAMLQELAGVQVTANTEAASPAAVADFHSHLQTLTGADVNADAAPVVCTSGLPTVASLWLALAARGGADIVMASTAYGGSSQLTDLMNERAVRLRKHTFHIQGAASMLESIREQLDNLAKDAAGLLPTTVLWTEVPTNPDMKVPEMAELTKMLLEYQRAAQRQVLLLVDATFAPSSQVLGKIRALAPELDAMVFISMSKSVSRGHTTAGALVANHKPATVGLLRDASAAAAMLGVGAKPDQLLVLVRNHHGVEERCQRAYRVAAAAGEGLRRAVRVHCSQDMPLAFVSPADAAAGFTSSTFSFNLPALPHRGPPAAELAQRYVDLLTAHAQFKPCVSFGQDNGLVYCTVPATSTQGAIKAEDKAKQAVGGVQLVRLSFPPTIDVGAAVEAVAGAVAALYGGAGA